MTAKKSLKGSTKRKIKVFTILLTCSFIAWLMTQLSETYTDDITLDLNYIGVPDSLMLMNTSHDKVILKVRSSGWQFLGTRFSSSTVDIDLSKVAYSRSRYFLKEQNFRDQLSATLPNAMTIIQMDTDTLFFDFSRLVSKKIPVMPDIDLQLAQNYLMDGDIRVTPDSVTLNGPEQELDTMTEVRTEHIELNEVSGNLERSVRLIKPETLQNTTFDKNEVDISANIFRFSEKILDIPVEVINLPEGTQIRTFPNSIEVLCKARLEQLKDLSPADFRVVADLKDVQENSSYLPVRLIQSPEGIPGIQLLQVQIEYILKRE